MTLIERVTRVLGLAAPEGRKGNALPALLGAQYGASASTEEGALRISAVYSCVRIVSETIASIPLLTYRRRADGGKERAENEPLYTLLRTSPNTEQTSFEWREQMLAHLLLRGNAFARIVRQGGVVTELVPLLPDDIEVKVNSGGAIVGYQYRHREVLAPSDVLHVRGMSMDGVMGLSVLRYAADTFHAAKSAQEYGRRVFENDATPGMVLKHPQTLDEEAAKRLRESWEAMFAGPRNAGRVAVLEEGMSVDKIQMSAEDLQFLDTRKMQRVEIASLFGVPAHMVGDLSQSTYSNIEQQAMEFVTRCVQPWCARIEQALMKKLLTPAQRRDLFVEFLMDGLIRGDIQSRYNAYMVGRQGGWLSVNDIRTFENMNPVAGGDRYLEPLNMQSVNS